MGLTSIKEKNFVAHKTRHNCMLYTRIYLKHLLRKAKNKDGQRYIRKMVGRGVRLISDKVEIKPF